jgi:NAD(P)H-hydrate epimerase
MKVSSVNEMRILDRTAIEQFGISEILLMENAGTAAFSAILNEFGVKERAFLIFCGAGNNGGDGLVVARKLHSMGGKVKVILLGDAQKFKGAAGTNYEIITKLKIPLSPFKSRDDLIFDTANSDILIDAIFGTGLIRDVEGIYRDVIEWMNSSGKPVFSLDIPSGVSGDTGQVLGCAVRADCTITFGLPKLGNILYPGFDLCGKLYVSHISFPPEMIDQKGFKIAINDPDPLPERDPNGHKGSFGDVLFIAGAAGYFGAPYFSALSFLKAGGGYSRLASPASIIPSIASKGSEIVFLPQEETSEGSLALSNKNRLIRLSEEVDMVVIGPGLSLNPQTQELVKEIVGAVEKPVLIDGDGLTAPCSDSEIISKRKHPTILTPHLGEMSRITGKPIPEIDYVKTDFIQKQAKKLNAILVLKGAHSLIGFPDGRVFINLSGNSGMATAGSGDVLTGVITAMSGAGLSLEDAVRTGVFLHGFSGDLAAAEKGEDGITAQDIMEFLPDAVRYYRDSYLDILRDSYQSIYQI